MRRESQENNTTERSHIIHSALFASLMEDFVHALDSPGSVRYRGSVPGSHPTLRCSPLHIPIGTPLGLEALTSIS